ncbi:MAG: hypothetical protein AB7V36_13490, partial [Bacteroidales bacterium]
TDSSCRQVRNGLFIETVGVVQKWIVPICKKLGRHFSSAGVARICPGIRSPKETADKAAIVA